MIARIISRISLWIGVIAALAIPVVPPVYRWFYPPRKPVVESKTLWDSLGALLDVFSSIGDGLAIFLWVVGLTTTALVASLVAIIAAWRAQESRRRKLLCGLPVVLVVIGYGLLIALAV